jgi:hypothetical protein
VEVEADTDELDLNVLASLFSRTALNMKSRLEFLFTTAADPGELVDRITHQPREFVSYEKGLQATRGEGINPPRKLTLFNGSPRGSKGNTAIMLKQVGDGFASVSEHSYIIHNLNRLKSLEAMTQAFTDAECVLLGIPLYTDAMPGMVKTFIESLAPLKDRDQNPPIGFLVQSGFPEALHSRYLERYLQRLAKRLKAPYLGTIVKGSGEGVRMMPQERNTRLFSALQGLGRSLSAFGTWDDELLKEVAGIERYPSIFAPFFKVFTRLPIASWYWDSQLKENGVYDQRFARPYQT